MEILTRLPTAFVSSYTLKNLPNEESAIEVTVKSSKEC
jgi:hypothetical protein